MSAFGTDPVLVNSRLTRTNLGTSRIDVYEGTAAGIESLLSSVASWQQWDWDDTEAPKYRLTVRTPEPSGTGSAPGTNPAAAAYDWSWELVGTEQQVSMYMHPLTLWFAQSATGIASPTEADMTVGELEIQNIKRAIQDPNPDEPFVSILAPPFDAWSTALFRDMVKGHTDFLWPNYVLRISLVVGPSFTQAINEDGTCRVWSAAGILNYYSGYPPTDRIRARMIELQNNSPATLFDVTGGDAEGYTWGWLAGPTTETELPDKRVRITREFKLELWNTSFTYRVYA